MAIKIRRNPPIEQMGVLIPTRGVLILGSYSQENRWILATLADAINLRGYLPIQAREFFRWYGQTSRQWIANLCAIVRFIIAEDSYPSGESLELKYCTDVGQVTAILRQEGIVSTWMTLDFDIHQCDMHIFPYTINQLQDPIERNRIINNIIQWAEQRLREREEQFYNRIMNYYRRPPQPYYPREI